MSVNFPNSLDTDVTLPVINNNITEIGDLAINALRDLAFNLENYLGLGLNGTQPSLAARLGVAILPNGNLNPSALTSLGLVTLPITQNQIANNAGIPESKLMLNYRTSDLFNYIQDLSRNVNSSLGWISTTGIQLEPHLLGAIYRHSLDQIDVSHNQTFFPYLNNVFRVPRNNLEAYFLINDINNELLAHQWADSYPLSNTQNIITNSGASYPSNYAHLASGIFLQTSVFTTIPQTANNVQLFAEFVDESSLLLLGSRIQNLYANGISRNSRSSSLSLDGYGQLIVPPTPATTFLRNTNNINQPVDDINHGDDIVQFTPSSGDGYLFASYFAAVNVGNIIRVNYGTVEVDFVILEKKYISNTNTYIVRIDGKNLFYTTNAIASVNQQLFNNNKYGVLAMAPVSITGFTAEPSLIIGAPRGAQTLGLNFNADLFDSTHYFLYLALCPNGSPQNGYLVLPGIDVTGNQGVTPGQYTLETIVAATNAAFQAPGYNYRFIAFQYQGEFGVMLADSYNDAAFSICSVVLNSSGVPDPGITAATFPNNVIGVLPGVNGTTPDPLGLGPQGSNSASPPYQGSVTTVAAALQPTKIFVPLKRNMYYVDGVEKEQMELDVEQSLDGYGDGYWVGTVINVNPIGDRVEVTYSIPLDLSTSQLKIGKTLVIQSLGEGGTFPTDFGRYIIDNVVFSACMSATPSTTITVYDAVHGIGTSPAPVISVGSIVGVYFNSSSVSFNAETATDFIVVSPFKRHFEVFIDEEAHTFTHERGRFYLNNTALSNLDTPPSGTYLLGNTQFSGNLNLISISPKLQGFSFGNVTKITLNLTSFNAITGIYDGYLCSWNNAGPMTNLGPLTIGKQGQTVRFYDQTNIDYIDLNLDFSSTISTFTNQVIDIQLFPSLALDQQIMIIGSCQINDNTQTVTYLQDLRQFGNTSEEQLTTSALDYIAAPTRLLQENGIIRGFDLVSLPTPTFTPLTGGTFNVTGTSNSVPVTGLLAGAINIGSILTFAPQPGVNYTVTSVTISSGSITNILLLSNYNGTTTTGTTASIASTFPNNVFFTGGEAIINGKIIQINNQAISVPIVQELIGPFTSQIPNSTIVWFLCINDEGEFQLIASTDFSPTSIYAATYLANGSETRLFYVFNPNSSSTPAYSVRGTYFADLIQNQKDVVVVAVLTANVISPGTNYSLASLTYNDARRYVYNGYGGLSQPFVFGLEASFRTFDALTTWLNQLTNYQSAIDNYNNVGLTVIVKDNFVISQTIIWNFGLPVIFEGDGGTFTITIAQGITIGNNVTFHNLQFIYTFNPVGDGFYVTTNLANPFNAAIYCNVDPVNGNYHLGFQNCLFTSPNQYRYGFIGFNFSISTCYAEDIQITNNRFETSFASDDLLAVITFSGPNVNPSTATGARLNNCNISNNFCNKNQMIMIASPLVGSNILDLITATNTTISGNTCGAINVMIKQDTPLNIPNVNFELDKSAGVIISDNTCRYIYSGFANGSLTDSTNTKAIYDVQGGYNLIVSNLTVINNNTSFIHLGCRFTTQIILGAALLSIRGNKLTAYNPAYLTPYFNNVVQSTCQALTVDQVVGS
jgi:hypothetical protein